jgi:4-amino-4-deoxy-L-arabinose transferase-like glycosyltransferase
MSEVKTLKIFKLIEPALTVIILSFGIWLYFYKLDLIPSGLYVDEAVVGYNAYSILKTGKDEYGKFFPIAFRFFGSYTPPLLVYLLAPLIGLFGLNLFSVRLISAVSGVLAVWLLLVFLKKSKLVKFKWTPYLMALLMVIAPWNLFYSRVGYEIAFSFFLFSLGAVWLWFGLKKPIFKILGLGLLSLSAYASHPAKYSAPLFMVLFLGLFFKEFFGQRNGRSTFLALSIAFLIQIPHLLIIQTPAFWVKTGLSYSGLISDRASSSSNLFLKAALMIFFFIREFLSQLMTYFSPRSLFFLPDPDPQRSIPDLSVFYFWLVIPYLLGIYSLYQKRKNQEVKFILALLLVSPLMASLAGDPFSTQRGILLLLPLMVIIALGMEKIAFKIKPGWLMVSLLILIPFSLLVLWRSYFVLFPKERAEVWGYGFDQLAKIIKDRPDTHFVIDQGRLKPAYIELAFFLKYPPSEIQAAAGELIKNDYYSMIDFRPEYRFGNIEIREIIWKDDIYKDQILVGDELAVSPQQTEEHCLKEVFEIKSPVEEIIFKGYQTNPEEKRAKDLLG